MNDWAVLALIYAVVFISSPLIVILHELGHAFAYLILTKPDKIDIYIGSYGNAKEDIQIQVGKIRFFIKSSFPFVKSKGMCRSYKAEKNYLKHIIILLAGPFFTLFSAGIFVLIVLFTQANFYVLISCFIFLGFSVVSLIGNLVPRDTNNSPFNMVDTGHILESDGKQILFDLKIKGLRPDYVEALDFIEQDDFEPAILKLKTILKALPNSRKLLRLMINTSIHAKQYRFAGYYIKQLEDKFELSANDLLQKGCYESFTNKHDDAIESYSKVLKLDKNNVVALNNIGSELIDKGAHQVAKRALERAIKLDPDFDHAYMNLGYSKVLQGELEAGKILIDQCLGLNPENADAYKTLGVYYLRLKDTGLAHANFNKALEIDKNLDLSPYDRELKLLEEQADTTKQDFEEYKSQCVKDIMSLQPEFMKLYDIDSYQNWFYDHDIGSFHFKSDDGSNLYFKYVEVGSFSTKNNTWNWKWDNKNTPKHVCRGLEKVKVFGAKNNFEQLTKGLFEGDEYTGWEMTAISAKLLNAIGSYRIPQGDLFIYFIFTNELTDEEYGALKNRYANCDKHISDRVAFVCQHLINNDDIGFNEAYDSDPTAEPDDDHQAWCDECEKIRLNEGEWTDEAMAFANIKVVCNQCYFEIKERNKSRL